MLSVASAGFVHRIGGLRPPVSISKSPPRPIEPKLKAEWAASHAPRPWPALTLAIIAGLAAIFGAE